MYILLNYLHAVLLNLILNLPLILSFLVMQRHIPLPALSKLFEFAILRVFPFKWFLSIILELPVFLWNW